ncbi:MAG: MFS transporter [Acidimicrobiales bacterium]
MTTQADSEASRSAETLDRRRRVGVLLICSMSLLVVSLDVTIVNVALPSIGRDFHASLSGLQWTVDAYTLVLASLLMLSGSTADRLGRRRTFVLGLVLFITGSLLCSLAPDLTALIIFRMLQALGGSMLNPVAMSIITNTFTDPKERAQAIGVWAAVVGFSMALGPIVGGALVDSVGWRSIFWINVPVGLLAVALALRFVPESRAAVARRVDVGGQALVIVFLASLTFAIIQAPSYGWSSFSTLAVFSVSLVALVVFVLWERRRDEPLVDVRFFRSLPFSTATLAAVAGFAGLGGFLFLNTLYLQEARGLSPLRAGLDTLPMAAMTLVIPPLSGILVGRRGARLPLVLGGAGVLVGSALLVRLGVATPFAWLFLAYVIFGAGFGFVNPPITSAAVSGMPRAQAGVASAIASTSRQVGATLGVAVVGALIGSNVDVTSRAAFTTATRAGWWVLCGCGALVVVLGLVGTTKRAHASATHTALELNPEYFEGRTT